MSKYSDYFDDDGFIIGNLNELKREKSLSTDPNEHHFELIEFENEIMLALNKEGDCGCTRHIVNKSELLRLRDFISGFYPNEDNSS